MTERITRDDVGPCGRPGPALADRRRAGRLHPAARRRARPRGRPRRLDLSDLEPTAHPFPLVNVFRADVEGPTSDRDEVLAAAPLVEEAQFRVPPVLGEVS